ncbi:Sapep family Mn(2+)-dependent dipeptidase [Paenibacillus antri]|nr:Sapep family Mn(2+)-dependent dipeptidase [Paenibacillus antri]
MLTGNEMAKYRDEIVHHIAELVRIRSVLEEPEEGKPFGGGVNRALEYMLELAASMGFQTKNVDGYAGYAEYGSGDLQTAVLVHLDTVHEGEGWTYPPFGGLIEDDRIIGRGASDNKGPSVVALYCLKAIRDLGLPIRTRIRVIFGTNEESGMKDMDYYFSKEPQPDFAFVPDAGYPMFNVEMGNAMVEISHTPDRRQETERLRIVGLTGGMPLIMQPDTCEVRIAAGHVSEGEWRELLNGRTNLKVEMSADGHIAITANGKTGDKPTNAIADLMEWLAGLPVATDAAPLVCFLHEKLGHETNGQSLDIQHSDEASGSTLVFLKQIVTKEDTVTAIINVRYPVTADGDRLLGRVAEQGQSYGLKMNITRHLHPVYVPPEHPVIRILSRVYERATGEKAELLRMGAGTYARKLNNNGVAFGAGLVGGVDNNVHRPDEYVRIEDMMKHAEICLQGMYELAIQGGESDEYF